jgi:hypothetical protein
MMANRSPKTFQVEVNYRVFEYIREIKKIKNCLSFQLLHLKKQVQITIFKKNDFSQQSKYIGVGDPLWYHNI